MLFYNPDYTIELSELEQPVESKMLVGLTRGVQFRRTTTIFFLNILLNFISAYCIIRV